MSNTDYVYGFAQSWKFGWIYEALSLVRLSRERGDYLAEDYLDTLWKANCGLPIEEDDAARLASFLRMVDPDLSPTPPAPENRQ